MNPVGKLCMCGRWKSSVQWTHLSPAREYYLITDPAVGWMSTGRDLFISFMSFCANTGWKGRSQDGDLLMLGVSQYWPPERLSEVFGSCWFVNSWWMNMGFRCSLQAVCCQRDTLQGFHCRHIFSLSWLIRADWWSFTCIFCEHNRGQCRRLPPLLIDLHLHCNVWNIL